MLKIAPAFEHFFETLQHQQLDQLPIKVCLSGGIDSMVLTHALHHWITLKKLRVHYSVIHINHQLQKNSDEFVQISQKLCRDLDIAFEVRTPTINRKPRQSLEDLARKARYEAILNTCHDPHVLLMAHHADDQAETFLLNALRGLDLNGLSGMKLLRAHQHCWIGRPMLPISPIEIAQYADENQLEWIEDVSNQDTALSRNNVRHNVMPALLNVNANAVKMLNRSAQYCAEKEAFVMTMANDWFVTHGQAHILDLNAWRHLPNSLKIPVLRLSLKPWQLPPHHQLEALKEQFEREHPKGQFVWWSNDEKVVCLIWRNYAYFYPQQALNQPPITYEQTKDCTVRYRIKGQRVVFRGRNQKLKRVLQSLDVLPWWRKDIPMLYKADQLIMIGDYCVAKEAQQIKFHCAYPLRMPRTGNEE